MTELERAVNFNKETRAGLELLYSELNHGQQQKLLKNEAVSALLRRYGVVAQ